MTRSRGRRRAWAPACRRRRCTACRRGRSPRAVGERRVGDHLHDDRHVELVRDVDVVRRVRGHPPVSTRPVELRGVEHRHALHVEHRVMEVALRVRLEDRALRLRRDACDAPRPRGVRGGERAARARVVRPSARLRGVGAAHGRHRRHPRNSRPWCRRGRAGPPPPKLRSEGSTVWRNRVRGTEGTNSGAVRALYQR